MRNRARFVGALHGYGLIPVPLVAWVADAVVAAEAAVAALCFAAQTRTAGLIGAAVLLVVFGIAGSVALARGARGSCGCAVLGQDRPLSWMLPVRNALLALACVTAAMLPHAKQRFAAAITGVVFVALAAVVVSTRRVVAQGARLVVQRRADGAALFQNGE
jgi:hypothetical protein